MGVRFTITMRRAVITSRTERGKQRLYDRSKNIFLQACRAYARGLAAEVGNHVDTGMSFASIMPFARFVNAVDVELTSTKSLPRRGMTDIMGVYHPERYKSITEGLHAGKVKKAFNVNFGSVVRPVFDMWFSIQVFQYFLHEWGYQTPAWNSLQKAERAFMEVLFNYRAAMVSGRRPLIRHEDFADVSYNTVIS